MDSYYTMDEPTLKQRSLFGRTSLQNTVTVTMVVLVVVMMALSVPSATLENFSVGSLTAAPRALMHRAFGMPQSVYPSSMGPRASYAPQPMSAALLRNDMSLSANKLPSTAGLMPKEEYCKKFGKTLILGGSRGLGLALVSLLKSNGCEVYTTVRNPSEKLSKMGLAGVVEGIDMLDYSAPQKLTAALGSLKLDTVIISAGYFTTEGPLKDLNRQEEVKMFEICAIAPVFVTAELLKNGNIGQGTRIGFITSEGGSIGLRTEKEGGANYGHHMSKTASNMAGRLMAWDLKPHGVSMVMIHPGFLRTEMTADKYAHLYDELDAVTADEAAPFILQPIADVTLETTGRFVAALGSQGLGLGVWALPMKMEYPADIPPGGELPF